MFLCFLPLFVSTLPPLPCRICNKCPPHRLPDGLCRWVKKGLLPWKPESTVTRGKNRPEKKESEISAFLTSPSFVPLLTSRHPLFSPFLSELNSHILALSIYLYSHLFTFLFKIFVYKCVYKLNIISSCPVSKWHLQGKGCVGLRFLIALQEPTKRQHRTLSKCV